MSDTVRHGLFFVGNLEGEKMREKMKQTGSGLGEQAGKKIGGG